MFKKSIVVLFLLISLSSCHKKDFNKDIENWKGRELLEYTQMDNGDYIIVMYNPVPIYKGHYREFAIVDDLKGYRMRDTIGYTKRK